MNIEHHLQDQIAKQTAILNETLPTIRAAEALEQHLKSAGIKAHAHAQLDIDGCSVIVFITASYASAINELQRIHLNPVLVHEQDGEFIKVRSYSLTVHGQRVSIVICPEIHVERASDFTLEYLPEAA